MTTQYNFDFLEPDFSESNVELALPKASSVQAILNFSKAFEAPSTSVTLPGFLRN
jgi:hypothetical protein